MIYNTIRKIWSKKYTRNIIKYKLTINYICTYTYFNTRKKKNKTCKHIIHIYCTILYIYISYALYFQQELSTYFMYKCINQRSFSSTIHFQIAWKTARKNREITLQYKYDIIFRHRRFLKSVIIRKKRIFFDSQRITLHINHSYSNVNITFSHS